MNKIILFSIAFLFTCLQVIGQKNVDFTKDNFPEDKSGVKEAIKNIEEGDDNSLLGPIGWQNALRYYLLAYAFNNSSAELNYKIGKTYILYKNDKNALAFLESAFYLNPHVAPDIHYYLGQAYHYNLELERAITEFKKYQDTYTPDITQNKRARVLKKIQECETGIEMMKNPVRVFIDNIGPTINTAYQEYAPVITADESTMIITSKRPTTTGGKLDDMLNVYMEDIYIAHRVNEKWQKLDNIGKPVNTTGHDASVGLSPDGQRMIIYIEDHGGDLYECKLKGEEWSKPKRFGKNINSDYHESSACYNFNMRTLYFVSDKPEDSYGDHDIYSCNWDDKKEQWGPPTNLGPTVNTEYKEESVYLAPDGKTLYFSSEGHKTMGGFDIFKSVLEDGKWSEPENLGYPINSADKDIFFVIGASGKRGYYTSRKKDGYGREDIYVITFLGPEKIPVLNGEDNLLASVANPVKEKVVVEKIEIRTSNLTVLKGVISDEKTSAPLEASIEIVDNTKNEKVATFISNETTGKYLITLPSGRNYGISVNKDDYLFHSVNVNIPANEGGYMEVVKDIPLKQFAVGTKIVLRNIFFPFDKYNLTPESNSELQKLVKLMSDMPTLKIRIGGHTDSKGSDTYNQKLSENRAKTVVQYLINSSIKKDRLEFAGYGEAQPMSTNDTDEGRQDNRRIEFEIISR